MEEVNKNKQLVMIGGVIVIIIMAVLLVWRFLLTSSQQNSQKTSQTPVETRAQDKTYFKYVSLIPSNSTLTETITPAITITPIVTLLPTTTLAPTLTSTPTQEPSPTEVIVVQSSPTQAVQLPETGMIEGSLAIFAVSLSLIVFAFVF